MDEHIHQSNLIEGYDDPTADKCLAEAWDFLSKQTKLTDGKIKTAQRLATNHQNDLKSNWRGQYRKIDVWIGGHKGMKPEFIGYAMAQWLDEYPSFTPKEAHVKFEAIHPFVDGNGRTGRMLMWWHEIKLGREPTLINAAERQQYYKWFQTNEEPNDSERKLAQPTLTKRTDN